MADRYARRRRHVPQTPEDAFVDHTWQFLAWAQHHARHLVFLLVVLVLTVAGVFYFRSYRASVTEQAAAELLTLSTELATAEPAVAAERLRGFVARYDGTSAALEARLVLARLELDLGQATTAIETLRPALDKRGADTPLGHAARVLLAGALETEGQADAALAIYADLGKSARLPFQRREARAAQARLLAESGRLSEAADILRELIQEAAQADRPAEAALYRVRLGEIEGLLAAGPSPPAASTKDAPDGAGPSPATPTAPGTADSTSSESPSNG